MMHSDSHALATLLLLRDIQQDRYRQRQQRWSAAAGAGEHHDDEEAEGCRADEDDDGDARATRPESLSALSASGLQMQQAMRVKPACAQAMQAVCPTICEILDPRTQNTIRSNRSVAAASDFIQSNKFVAQILAMVCEDRGVRALLGELLGADGVSFSVRPSAKYAAPHEELSFFELQLRAQVCCRFRRLSFLSGAAAPRAGCQSVGLSVSSRDSRGWTASWRAHTPYVHASGVMTATSRHPRRRRKTCRVAIFKSREKSREKRTSGAAQRERGDCLVASRQRCMYVD
jgi:hypothetical protein